MVDRTNGASQNPIDSPSQSSERTHSNQRTRSASPPPPRAQRQSSDATSRRTLAQRQLVAPPKNLTESTTSRHPLRLAGSSLGGPALPRATLPAKRLNTASAADNSKRLRESPDKDLLPSSRYLDLQKIVQNNSKKKIRKLAETKQVAVPKWAQNNPFKDGKLAELFDKATRNRITDIRMGMGGLPLVFEEPSVFDPPFNYASLDPSAKAAARRIARQALPPATADNQPLQLPWAYQKNTATVQQQISGDTHASALIINLLEQSLSRAHERVEQLTATLDSPGPSTRNDSALQESRTETQDTITRLSAQLAREMELHEALTNTTPETLKQQKTANNKAVKSHNAQRNEVIRAALAKKLDGVRSRIPITRLAELLGNDPSAMLNALRLNLFSRTRPDSESQTARDLRAILARASRTSNIANQAQTLAENIVDAVLEFVTVDHHHLSQLSSNPTDEQRSLERQISIMDMANRDITTAIGAAETQIQAMNRALESEGAQVQGIVRTLVRNVPNTIRVVLATIVVHATALRVEGAQNLNQLLMNISNLDLIQTTELASVLEAAVRMRNPTDEETQTLADAIARNPTTTLVEVLARIVSHLAQLERPQYDNFRQQLLQILTSSQIQGATSPDSMVAVVHTMLHAMQQAQALGRATVQWQARAQAQTQRLPEVQTLNRALNQDRAIDALIAHSPHPVPLRAQDMARAMNLNPTLGISEALGSFVTHILQLNTFQTRALVVDLNAVLNGTLPRDRIYTLTERLVQALSPNRDINHVDQSLVDSLLDRPAAAITDILIRAVAIVSPGYATQALAEDVRALLNPLGQPALAAFQDPIEHHAGLAFDVTADLVSIQISLVAHEQTAVDSSDSSDDNH